MKKITGFFLLAFLITACLPQDVQVPQSPLLPFLERKAGLIAYIGLDGNVYWSDQAGGNVTQVTTDAQLPDEQSGAFRFYQYPTWSPDGSQLAMVAVSGESDGIPLSEMFIRTVDSEGNKKIYTSESWQPFYLYWSPNNESVSFLATDATGQSIILQSASVAGGDPLIIDVGAPYYWSWAPDGKTMIVHTGSTASSTPEHLAFLQVGSEVVEDALDSIPGSFQAPAWSPNGEQILYSRINDQDGKEIVIADSTGAFEEVLAEFTINTAFAWSPDSQLVAYIEGDRDTSAGALGKLHVIDLETAEDFFQDEEVFAFFWSPNSRKLAYFKPRIVNAESSSEQVLLLELHMLDTVSGETNQLFTFQPTNQFSSILPYFDQYHQSATIWSPDSNNLVLSFIDQEGNPGIAVVAASGQLQPRILTAGYLAYWSPK
jgi:hypothetical protein